MGVDQLALKMVQRPFPYIDEQSYQDTIFSYQAKMNAQTNSDKTHYVITLLRITNHGQKIITYTRIRQNIKPAGRLHQL
jgi:hypothetical protein